MKPLHLRSMAEQVAGHLREQVLCGDLTGLMPGSRNLAAELGANHKTVEEALRVLAKEGMLESRGAGRRRGIVVREEARPQSSLRVAILLFVPEDLRVAYIVELQHLLAEAGHSVIFPTRSMSELGMDLKRVSRLVEKTGADAWVVVSGSREVLAWFAAQPVPAFALFGRRRGLPIAGIGPDKVSAYGTATRRLLGLGHRRIAIVVRPSRRLPEPGLPERAFLDELELAGIGTGDYNLPDWDGSIGSLHLRLEEMYRITPPTALILDEPPIFLSVQQWLARRGILAPEQVSLICTDGDPYFDSLRPTVAHIRWDSRPWVQRIVRWASGVAHGKDDRSQTLTRTEFVEGGTIGPAKGRG